MNSEIIEQIAKQVIIPLNIAGVDISVTTVVLVMWIAAALVFGFFFMASRRISLVPSGLQNLAESYIEAIDENIFSVIGADKKIWLPFLIALFSFIFICNLTDLLPGVTAPSSNINFTATLAIMVFFLIHAVGVWKHGAIKYLSALAPSAVPWPMKIFMLPIELVSQLAKPFSLAVRLFANLLAGHTILLTIIGMILVLKTTFLVPLPIIGGLVLSLFEVFIALIQAFVFSFLAALYISQAIKLEH